MIAISVLVSRSQVELDLFYQTDRAIARLVTHGDWFSDCIGVAYLYVEVGSPRSNSTRIDVSHLIERSDYLSHIS